MAGICEKRDANEALFKWDSIKNAPVSFEALSEQTTAKRRQHGFENAKSLIQSTNQSELTDLFHTSTVNGLLADHEHAIKGLDKRQEMLESIRTFQLNTCKDWLGANSTVNSLKKLDTLDRLSCLIMNPEGSIRSDILLYSHQMGKCDFDFHNALYITKIWQISNLPVLQFIKQPLLVRNKLLVSREKNNCDCPIGLLTRVAAKPLGRVEKLASEFNDTQSSSDTVTELTLKSLYKELGKNRINPVKYDFNRVVENICREKPDEKKVTEAERIDVEDNIICPYHVAKVLPDLMRSKGVVGILKDYKLLYRYEDLTVSGKSYNVLSFHKLTNNGKVWQYKLPSKLLTLNSVYLRDFELERCLGDLKRGAKNESWSNYLSKTYTGQALFIITKTEIMIVILHSSYEADSLTLGVILRDKYKDLDARDVVCHRPTGRIFILSAASLLYEYRYQLGLATAIKKVNPIRVFVDDLVNVGKNYISKFIKRDKIYKLHGTISTGYNDPDDCFVNNRNSWWDGKGNCLDDLNINPPDKPSSYWPPIKWKELHITMHECAFTDEVHYQETCDCVSPVPCSIYNIERSIKLINPQNKSLFPLFRSGDSLLDVDDERWLILMLTVENGDLTVFKIPSTCTFDEYKNGVEHYDKLFPFDLVEYSIRQYFMKASLEKLGYFKFVGQYSTFRVNKAMPAPRGLDGIDVILVDNHGTRIFVGFSVNENKGISLSVKGFRLSFDLLQKQLSNPSKVLQTSSSVLLALDKKSLICYILGNMYITIDMCYKTDTCIIAKLVIIINDSTSFCQMRNIKPLSISEEFWSYNQMKREVKENDENQPIDLYDTFYLRLENDEKILGVLDLNPEILLVTTQRIYTFCRMSLLNIVHSLVKHPVNTIKIIDPPPVIRGRKAKGTTAVDVNSLDYNASSLPKSSFMDIFSNYECAELCNEDIKKVIIGNGLYHLSWLYTSEELFKVLWSDLLGGHNSDEDLDIVKSMLTGVDDESCLFLNSLGIPSKLYGWVAPGCYALDESGGLEKPVISPWCKFVSFGSVNSVRYNRVSTNNTSPAIDGILLLTSQLIEPFWIQRTFTTIPTFTTKSLVGGVDYSSLHQNSAPVSPETQLGQRNEFVTGGKVETNLVHKLSLDVDEVRTTLEKLLKLCQLISKVLDNYEKSSVEVIVKKLSRLPLNVQEDIMNHSELSLEGWVRARYEMDLKTLMELLYISQIAQEYIACCLMIHETCVLGNVTYEFDKLLQNVIMLPSKSLNFYNTKDLSHQCNTPVTDESLIISPFSMSCLHSPRHSFVISKGLFNIISHSNLLNLCYNKEFFRIFKIATWLIGGNVSNLQEYFYGHIFREEDHYLIFYEILDFLHDPRREKRMVILSHLYTISRIAVGGKFCKSSEELDVMVNCNSIKYLERQHEDNQDNAAISQYLKSLVKLFTRHKN